MPHVSSRSGGDDLGSEDEVKVFKDEGEDEERSSENFIEEKSSLIDFTDSEEKVTDAETYSTNKTTPRCDITSIFAKSSEILPSSQKTPRNSLMKEKTSSEGKLDSTTHSSSFNMGYLVSASYPYPNGAGSTIPISVANKISLGSTHPSGLPFFCTNGDQLAQPPPAHMGIPPYATLDAGKAAAAAGLSRTSVYPFSAQYPYSMLSTDVTQVAASWHTPSIYSISTTSAGFRNPYPTSLPITSSSLASDLYRFSPTGIIHPQAGMGSHAHALPSHVIISSVQKSEHSLDHNQRSSIESRNTSTLPADNTKNPDTGQHSNPDKKKPHIKKPLNAFMLYMKEMRAKVVAECTLKESAAINQILGRRWHALGREEQAKYYELARRERQLHMQLYPDWSSRTNNNRTKKRKRKQDAHSDSGGNNLRKSRTRFEVDQQNQWCKPCSPLECESGTSISANIIHHNVRSSATTGVDSDVVSGRPIDSSSAHSIANTGSSTTSHPQEPTYVNL